MKRIFSVLIAAVMIVTVFPATIRASSPERGKITTRGSANYDCRDWGDKYHIKSYVCQICAGENAVIIDLGRRSPTNSELAKMIADGRIPRNTTHLSLKRGRSDPVITDISPLAELTELKWLSLHRQNVSDFSPLEGLENLVWLDLERNEISDISTLAGLTSLERLDLDRNRITDISPLGGLVNLIELDLNDNPITDISVLKKLVNLQELDLDYTKVKDISVLSGLTELRELELSGVQISDLTPLAGLTELVWLNLNYIPVRDLTPLHGLKNLERVDLMNTLVSAGDVRAFSAAVGNGCFIIHNAFDEKSRKIDLSGRAITDEILKQIIDEDWLRDDIVHLNLNNNRISDITPLAKFTQLEELDLSYPLFRWWYSNYTDEEYDDFAENFGGISDLSPLSGLTNLQWLTLSGNNISDLSPLSGLTNLRYLRLCNNPVSDLRPLSGMTELTEFWLTNYWWEKESYLTSLDGLENLTSLQFLRMYGNAINDISAIANLTNLKELWLYYNNIEDVSPLKNLTNLTMLRLMNNEIKDISALSGMSKVIYLEISHNQISDISALSGFTSLEGVQLQNNLVTDLRPLVNLPNLRSITCGENLISHPHLVAMRAAMPRLNTMYGLSFNYSTFGPICIICQSGVLIPCDCPVYPCDDCKQYNCICNEIPEKPENPENPKLPENPDTSVKVELRTRGITDDELARMVDDGRIPQNVTSLDLANNPISDLTPLSGLTQLEYLCLEMSWDTTDYNRNHEALSTLTNLRFLVLNNNFISDLSFLSELTSLEYLYLDGNQISDLSRLSALTKLGMLELNHNQISDLTPLYGLFGLAEYDNCSRLSLHGNPLTVEQVDELIAVLGADRQLIRFNPDYPYYYCYDCRQNDCICNEIPEKPEKPVIIPSPEGILTAELLQAIRNSGAVVTIELPCGMLITIDPRTVKPNVQDVPISVEIESGGSHADGIPNNSIIILPSAQGEFGFEFSFDITAEQLAEAGLNIDNAQLFYVNGNGITQQHGELTRNSDGSVTITIDRASSYVLAAVTHGDVTGTGAVTIADVLEILKSLAGMSSVIDDNVIALQAALIVNPTATKPSIADALEILKHLAGMKSVLAN